MESNGSSEKKESDAFEVEEQVNEIAEKFLESLKQGQPDSQADLVAAHPELAPHLEARLKLYEVIFRATLRPDGLGDDIEETSDARAMGLKPRSSFEMETHATPRASLEPNPTARIRCPHCGNQVQLVDIQQAQEITCGSCGSAVRVTDEDATRTDETHKLPDRVSRFTIIRRLGQGAFGTVYLANDPKLSRSVALKVPRHGFFVSLDEEQRFFREARSAAKLKHENIVTVHEISEKGYSPFIVSEFIDGLTLGDLASRGLTTRETAEFMVQVCDAVAYAHENGVIHRDLKPSNILVDHDNKAYVADFGLARRDDLEITMTLDGTILGTPAYMSPEQAIGIHDNVGKTSDVYSLGVILYRLLCRELPFHGTKRMLLHQVIREEPKSPRRLNDLVPRDLETITLKAMAKAPEQRFQTASDMGDELRRWLDGRPIKSRPISSFTRLARWCKRHPTVASLLGVVATLLILVAVISATSAIREAKLKSEAVDGWNTAKENKAESDARLYATTKLNSRVSLASNDLTRSQFWQSQSLRLQPTETNRLGFSLNLDQLPTLNHVSTMPTAIKAIRNDQSGNRIAVLDAKGNVNVIDLQSGKELFTQEIVNEYVFDMDISSSGNKVAFQSGTTVELRNINSGRLIQNLSHGGAVLQMDFDESDEYLITGGVDSIARVWDANTGAEKYKLSFEDSRIFWARFIPGSDLAILLTNKESELEHELHFWDYQNKEAPSQTISLALPPLSYEISPDNKRLALTTSDQKLHVYDIDSGESVGKQITLTDNSRRVFFAKDKPELVIVDIAGFVGFWNYETAERTSEAYFVSNDVTYVSTDPSGEILAFSLGDGTVRFLWRATGRDVCSLLHCGQGATHARFLPNGRQVVVGGQDGRLQVWDLSGTISDGFVFEHKSQVRNALFTPDGERVLTISLEGKAFIWNADSGQAIADPLVHEKGVGECAVSDDGLMFATVGGDQMARVWDSFTGKQIGSPFKHEAAAVSVSFQPGGERLAVGCTDGSVSCWKISATKIPDQKPIFVVNHEKKIRYLAFNRDGTLLASASMDGTARVWDAATGLPKHGPFEHRGFVSFSTFMPNQTQLLTSGAGGEVYVWDLSSGDAANQIECEGEVVTVAVLDDGARLITNETSGKARIWRKSGDVYVSDKTITHPVNSTFYFAQLKPDSNIVLAGGGGANSVEASRREGVALFWDAEDDSQLGPPIHHFGLVRRCYFDEKGEKVLTASIDGRAKLVNIAPSQLEPEDAARIAQLYSQWSQSESGEIATMSAERQAELFKSLSNQFPDLIRSTSSEIKNWKQQVEYVRQVQNQ